MSTTTANPPRRRRRFRPVEVASVQPLTPRMVRVTLTGEALDGFEISAPTQHVKLLFPVDGQDAPALPESGPDGLRFPDDAPRPVMRTFTPRRFDAATTALDVEFVLHGDGPASAWAAQAAPGQRIAVAGPGGRLPLALEPGHWVIAGDESAIPAVGTLLAVLPTSTSAQVYLEVENAADHIELESAADTTVTWLHRRPDTFGDELLAAVTGAALTGATGVWVACEATAVRRIRRALLGAGAVDTSALVTRGYWRLGEENHPDHDHGEDADS